MGRFHLLPQGLSRSAYSLIELVVSIAVLSILTAVVVQNYSQARVRARDTSRRESMTAYQASLEQYFASRHTYFVYSSQAGGCTFQAGASGGVPSGTGNGCVGYNGSGQGMLTRRGVTNYPLNNLSIADALQKDGFLSEIRLDPRTSSFTDDPRGGSAANFDDYVLAVCNSQGVPPQSVSQATVYAIYANLEQPTAAESAAAAHYCGGSQTPGGGWNLVP